MLPPSVAPARALAASRRRPSARANWRSASQSRGWGPGPAGCGRAFRDGGNRQQRPPDIAVAARPRQPDVAGAEGVAQVEQHRRLPEAGIDLGASRRLHFEFGRRKLVGRAFPPLRRTSTASSKG